MGLALPIAFSFFLLSGHSRLNTRIRKLEYRLQDGCGTVQSLHAKYGASVSKPQSSEPTTNAQVSKPNIKTASETPRDDLEVSNHNKAVSPVPLTSTPDIQNSKIIR